MLKVLHFYKTYYPDSFGGIEQVIFQLSEAGACHQIESTTLSLSTRGDIDNERVGMHTAYYAATNFEVASTPFSVSAISKFKALAAQADIIHYHFPYPFMDLVHFIAGVKKPTVVSYHSDIVKQKLALKLYTPLMNKFLSSVDCIVAASPNYVETSPVLQKYLPKVKVIPYGLDKKSYPVADEAHLDRWRQQVGDRFFLFVGAFRYYKGLHILLEAIQNTDFPLVIIGAGPIEAELKQQAQDLGLKKIHFLGALPDEDKAALLELCYSVVFPSHLRSEAFGITLLEGAMYGKPLISSEIGTGTTYINIDQETGLVVPPSDPQALRAAMTTLWEDPELAQRYGDNAAKRFQALFTSKRMAESYIELYQQLINK
ncbi:glycosyltransferase family 4 protein [Serratia quinivorans]|uniref:glycosyltransferase family 4 protein n=1 Tax=Serratia quinivorans TaxID=137545 RepID=UPI00217A7C35|nr:glycosyltransferase family 4 protein [Serratia quinivorans]CAI1513936.1 GDP-mannose-dependent alpha-(1-2)-phosphatidylinositol mannosyltransferase [Serratia quinivorans]CAI1584748.1 GDP-mannose-dependent alpha-(1-2)-phosphatidylinositol mannosyltransferase [Serratia quinivorans]